MEKSLYQTLKDAGIELDNHESDLYFEVTAKTTGILLTFPIHFENAQRFHASGASRRLMYDIPFAFAPYWDDKSQANQSE